MANEMKKEKRKSMKNTKVTMLKEMKEEKRKPLMLIVIR